MPVQIGQPAAHGFDSPMGMMSDCHRRIERFAGVLAALARKGGALVEEEQRSLAAALDYFRESGPRHTADEEESLFPRLRAMLAPGLAEVLAEVERLEGDHREAEALHQAVERLGSRWLSDGGLEAEDAAQFRRSAERLLEIYAAHIAIEDQRVFPAAVAALGRGEQMEIGREMAARRKVDANAENRRS